MIQEVGLVEKTHILSSQLSGGQKRKLSVAIALIGDSKVVFLVRHVAQQSPPPPKLRSLLTHHSTVLSMPHAV